MGMGERILYGSAGSGSAAIEMALRVARIRYRLVRASSWERRSAIAELLRVNPLGQIPTLVEPDGTVVSESVAILVHLALAHPRSGLLPGATDARARALRGLVFIAANCYPAVSVSDHPERWTAAATAAACERVRQAARVRLHRSWEVFADLFADDPVLAGPPPAALAFLSVVVSQWSGARRHLATARPGFLACIERLERHPRLADILAQHRSG